MRMHMNVHFFGKQDVLSTHIQNLDQFITPLPAIGTFIEGDMKGDAVGGVVESLCVPDVHAVCSFGCRLAKYALIRVMLLILLTAF
jgi:hypothetical protein